MRRRKKNKQKKYFNIINYIYYILLTTIDYFLQQQLYTYSFQAHIKYPLINHSK